MWFVIFYKETIWKIFKISCYYHPTTSERNRAQPECEHFEMFALRSLTKPNIIFSVAKWPAALPVTSMVIHFETQTKSCHIICLKSLILLLFVEKCSFISSNHFFILISDTVAIELHNYTIPGNTVLLTFTIQFTERFSSDWLSIRLTPFCNKNEIFQKLGY